MTACAFTFAVILCACADEEPSERSKTPAPAESPATALPGGDLAKPSVRATFVADVALGAGAEDYVCYAIDAPALEDQLVRSIAWWPPDGPVGLHHASLFAARDPIPAGQFPCDEMPDRVAAFGLYTPGAVPLSLPADTAIRVPPGARSLVVLAHVLRSGPGEAQPISIDLGLVEPGQSASVRVLNWIDVFAPVPAILPHTRQSSIGLCTFAAPVHIVTTWPHMHRRGLSFLGLVIRADGRAETLIDIPAWSYELQPIYPVDVTLAAGDSIQTICTWQNPTEEVIEGGPFVNDEMCNQGLFAWPANHAFCAN